MAVGQQSDEQQSDEHDQRGVAAAGSPKTHEAVNAGHGGVVNRGTEVAARHRLSEKTIRKRIYDDSLRAVDQSPPGAPARQRHYRIHREAEEAWIAAKGKTSPTCGACS
jgi:hypothetical protein